MRGHHPRRQSSIPVATSRSVLHSRSRAGRVCVCTFGGFAPLFLSISACSPRSSSGTALTVKVSAFHGHRDHARPTHSRPGSAPRFPPRSRRERGRAVPIRGRVLCSSSWRPIVARKFSSPKPRSPRSIVVQDGFPICAKTTWAVFAFRTPHPVHRYIYMIFYDNGPCPIALSLPYCVSVAWRFARREALVKLERLL